MSELAQQRPAKLSELQERIGSAATGGVQVRLTGSDCLPLTQFDESRPIQAISTLRMNKVLEHAVDDMTVIVQAGISLEGLQRELAWRNQWLPVDPPAFQGRNAAQRTIGGLIASNSLGPLRYSAGDWRLLIMGMRWVDAGGTMIKGGGRTVKNVAGYNTPRMMIGSCGSLGAIGEVTLRTFARPADEQCVILFADTAERAEAIISEVMLSPMTPAYIEAVGGRTFAGNPLALPAEKGGMMVAVGFLDRAASCAAQIAAVRELSNARGAESISQTAAQAGRLRQWLTTEPALERGASGLGVRIHTASSRSCGLVGALEKRATGAGGNAWVVSEAGSGVVRAVISGSDAEAIVGRAVEACGGGSVFATQGAKVGRAAEARGGDGALARRIKRELDPGNIFGNAPVTTAQ